MKDLPLDSSINDYKNISNDVEIGFDDNLKELIESSRLNTATDLLQRFVFTVPFMKNKEYFASRMVTPILKELLKAGECHKHITIPSLRQAFVYYKNETGHEEVTNLYDLYFNKVISREFGHNPKTHIENYGVVQNVSNIERTQDFHASCAIMTRFNQNLGFISKFIDKVKKVKLSINVNTEITLNEFNSSIEELYPSITFRPLQIGLMSFIANNEF